LEGDVSGPMDLVSSTSHGGTTNTSFFFVIYLIVLVSDESSASFCGLCYRNVEVNSSDLEVSNFIRFQPLATYNNRTARQFIFLSYSAHCCSCV
jgi:hypothetical protein